MNPPTTIFPSPTESAGISQNEEISAGQTEEHSGGRVYGAVGFSAGVIVADLGALGVEEPIDYHPTVETLRQARPVEERDFPAGGPFGA